MPERTRSSGGRPGTPQTSATAGPSAGPAPARAAPDAAALAAGDVDETAASYGNQAGAAARQGGAIADQVPGVLDLAAVGGSFQLPADKQVTGGWNPLTTGRGSTVWITMSSSSLRVQMYPPMVVDATWPMSNVEWSGFTYDFRTASVAGVDVRNTQTPFAFGAKSFVDDAVREFVKDMVRGTPLAKAGYDPMRDPDPQGTLQRLYANVGGQGGGSELGAADVGRIAPSATFKTRTDIEGGGVRVPAGTSITAAAGLRGSAADLQQGGLTAIDWVSLDSDGIEISHKGEPVARIQGLRLDHGGAIDVTRFEPLGKARDYGNMESGLRGLFLLFQAAAVREGANPGALQTDLEPRLVNGMTEREIEKALSDAARTLIQQHHDAVPGLDLRGVLGVSPRS